MGLREEVLLNTEDPPPICDSRLHPPPPSFILTILIFVLLFLLLFVFSLPPLFTFNSVFLLLLIPSLSLLEFHIILHSTAQNIIGDWWWCWIWWYRVSILLIHPYLHFPHPPPCSIPFSINISSLKHCCAGQVACHITFSRRQFPGTSRWLLIRSFYKEICRTIHKKSNFLHIQIL